MKPYVNIYYWPNGNKQFEVYMIDNKYHREDGPAKIYYHENGNIRCKIYYIDDHITKRFFYYENGNIRCKVYYIDDHITKRFFYYENGQLEQEDYWINNPDYPDHEIGILHREDGPARIQYHENGIIKKEEYSFEGEILSIFQWMIMVSTKKGE